MSLLNSFLILIFVVGSFRSNNGIKSYSSNKRQHHRYPITKMSPKNFDHALMRLSLTSLSKTLLYALTGNDRIQIQSIRDSFAVNRGLFYRL